MDEIQVSIGNVHLDGATWQMWYGYYDQTGNRIGYATSDRGPGVPPLDSWQYISAAAVASGAQGSFYQTDVDLNNADDQAVEYEFEWFPRCEDNSDATVSEFFTLGADGTLLGQERLMLKPLGNDQINRVFEDHHRSPATSMSRWPSTATSSTATARCSTT
ncbi:MAG: hypothetical protein V2I67_09135 [Thermoanaerobaculales bacterium]|nr:hypothetical protein [Thermoanaerobaculales bacterium]